MAFVVLGPSSFRCNRMSSSSWVPQPVHFLWSENSPVAIVLCTFDSASVLPAKPVRLRTDQADQQAYNADRFGATDLGDLSAEMRRLVDLGAHVIFCWGERAQAAVPAGGAWIEVGRDYVWVSDGLSACALPSRIAHGSPSELADASPGVAVRSA